MQKVQLKCDTLTHPPTLVMGRIAGLASGLNLGHGKTPFTKDIEHLLRSISLVAGCTGVCLFVIAMSLGYYWLDALFIINYIIVANVPDGLLVILTVCLTLTAEKMSRQNCLSEMNWPFPLLEPQISFSSSSSGLAGALGKVSDTHRHTDTQTGRENY